MAPMARRVQTRKESNGGFRIRRLLAWLLVAGVLPGTWLQSAYLAWWLGEGRRHLGWVVVIIFLPFTTLWWLLRHHPRAWRVSVLLWGCMSWLFTLFVWLVIPSVTSEVVAGHGAWMFSYAGTSSRSQGDRMMAMVSQLTKSNDNSVPFVFEQGSILVPTELSTNSASISVRMILDTGASFTTISPEDAARLGISPGPRSPSLHVQTASGEADYPLVVLSSLEIGKVRVGPIVVAVCGPCAAGRASGLLGLNFTRHFQMVVDNAAGRIRLHHKMSRIDQRDELEPFLEVGELSGREEGDIMHVTGRVANLSSVPMVHLAFDVTLQDSAGRALNRRRILLERIDPGAFASLSTVMATHPNVNSFHMELVSGEWLAP